MKSRIDKIKFSTILALIFLFPGCNQLYLRPIAGIIAPGSDSVILIKASSKYPIVLFSIDEQKRTLTYVRKDRIYNHYVITTYDYFGNMVKQTNFPKFSNLCWNNFGYPACFSGSISPNMVFAAYLETDNQSNDSENNLVLFDSSTGNRKILFKGLPENRVYVTNLFWLSNSEILVTVDESGKNKTRLMLIDVQKTAIKIDLLCNVLNQQIRLSNSKRYLAYWEGITRYSSDGRYKIFDLVNNEIISETEICDPELSGQPVWSSDDDILFYVADNKLFKFEILSKKTEILKAYDKNISISLQDYQENRLYFMPNEIYKLDQIIRLHSFDIIERKEYELWEYPQGPFHVYICKDLTAIYYKIGEHFYTAK